MEHTPRLAPSKTQESQARTPEISASRLQAKTIGEWIKIAFYKDVTDYELAGKTCVITAFDGSWAHVEYVKKKETVTRLIPIFSILSITYAKEAV